MLVNYGLSLVAGLLTVLSPCVLPLLPILLAGANARHRLGPLALISGLVLISSSFGFSIAVLGQGGGFDPDLIRHVGGGLLAGFGVLMLMPRVMDRLAVRLEPITGTAAALAANFNGNGLAAQFAIGALCGVIWSPCAGPTLGAAIGLATQAGGALQAAVMMLSFSIGAALPMLVLAYGSRAGILGKKAAFQRLAGFLKPAAAMAFLLIGLLTLSGLDRRLESGLVEWSPAWLTKLTTRI